MFRVFAVRRWMLLSVVLLAPVAVFASSANPPEVSFSFSPDQPTTNDVVVLDASGSLAQDAQISQYEWDFEGDGVVDLITDQPQVRHFFDHSGPFEVTLHVDDDAGGRSSLTQTVSVADSAVVARRTWDTTLEPNRVLAGGSIFVTVTLQMDVPASGLGLVERLPQGWRARPLDNGGALFKRAGDELQFLWAESINPGRTINLVYEVIVPEGALRGSYDIQGEVSSFSPQRIKLPVYSLLDIEVL